MKVTIDRFEGDFAVVLNDEGKSFAAAKALFEGAKEGEVYEISRDGGETAKRREKIKNLIDEVFE